MVPSGSAIGVQRSTGTSRSAITLPSSASAAAQLQVQADVAADLRLRARQQLPRELELHLIAIRGLAARHLHPLQLQVLEGGDAAAKLDARLQVVVGRRRIEQVQRAGGP